MAAWRRKAWIFSEAGTAPAEISCVRFVRGIHMYTYTFLCVVSFWNYDELNYSESLPSNSPETSSSRGFTANKDFPTRLSTGNVLLPRLMTPEDICIHSHFIISPQYSIVLPFYPRCTTIVCWFNPLKPSLKPSNIGTTHGGS